MHLYLIRHGESYMNLEGGAQRHIDASLTDLGQQQAVALATWLPNKIATIDALYSSTLQRARETASHLARVYNCPIQEDDRLREVGSNRLDHTPWPNDDPQPELADFWEAERPFTPVTLSAKQGESWMHFRTRVGSFVEAMVEHHRDQVVVAVCHGGVINAAFDHIFNVGPWRRCEVWPSNSGLIHFEYVDHPGREAWRLHYLNRIDHLNGERGNL